jgi:hypothetical protein
MHAFEEGSVSANSSLGEYVWPSMIVGLHSRHKYAMNLPQH